MSNVTFINNLAFLCNFHFVRALNYSEIIKRIMRKSFFILLFILGMGEGIFAQDARYQALFIYNFTRYIQWPNVSSSEFTVGVLGRSQVFSELQKVMGDKKIGAHTVAIKQFSHSSEIGNCQILYVSSEVSAEVSQLVSMLQNKNTLIITERSGMVKKGAGICFAVEDGKQRFEISKANVERTGLQVNNQLLDMAIVRD
jgi:hypothetical protein